MMRKKKIIAAIVFAVMSALMFSAPASAHLEMNPCVQTAEPGHSEFAKHHIVPLVGQESAHNPGVHRGYSACNPSGR